jgi:DNA helicase II / ATP-dependent DNA helicase PcrA
MAKFKASPQQNAYFQWITTSVGSAVLEAVAGAGKTTTLIQGLSLMSGTIFFGAFNKKIADEISAKAGNRDGLTVSTMHAAGFRAFRNAVKFVKVDGNKCRDIFRDVTFRNIEYGLLEYPVLQLVSYAKQSGLGLKQAGLSDIKNDRFWRHLINHFNVEVYDERCDCDNSDAIIRLAITVLEKSIEQNSKIVDFDDMIYAPLYHGVRFQKYDWVLIDEAQDTNITRRLLASAMLAKNGRLVAVGDRHQAIYGFTGADSDALDLIAKEHNAVLLPLTVTYRCPKAVVEYAHKWVSHIEAHPNAAEGEVIHVNSEANVLDYVGVGDAIVCRFNAPLISYVYHFLAKGIPAKIEGKDIATGIKSLARRWKVKSFDAYFTRLDSYLERETAILEKKDQLHRVSAIEDKVNCLRVLVSRVMSIDPKCKDIPSAVCKEIDTLFGDDLTGPVLTLSTIHKCKGREWENVLFLDAGSSPYATLPWQQEQESNLYYVAVTRAIKRLIVQAIKK